MQSCGALVLDTVSCVFNTYCVCESLICGPDTPPGTSDEHLTVVGAMRNNGIDGAVIVTTPQPAALITVRKEARLPCVVHIRTPLTHWP